LTIAFRAARTDVQASLLLVCFTKYAKKLAHVKLFVVRDIVKWAVLAGPVRAAWTMPLGM
jgi:hypothetical protein